MASRNKHRNCRTFRDLFEAGKLDQLKATIKSTLELEREQTKPNSVSSPLSTPLIEAAHHGYYDYVRFFLDEFRENIDINEEADIKIRSPPIKSLPERNFRYERQISIPLLVAACTNDNVEMVQYLVSKGTDLKKQSLYLGSPLHAAAVYGCIAVMTYLLDSGVDINTPNYRGSTALMMMCGIGILPVTQDRGQKESSDEFNDIAEDVFKFLTCRGANLHQKTKEGYSLMHEAARCGRVDIIKVLLTHSISPLFSIEDSTSEDYVPCPLYLAAINGLESTVKYLCNLEICPAICKGNAYLLLALSAYRNLTKKKTFWLIGLTTYETTNHKPIYPPPLQEYEYTKEILTRDELNEAWDEEDFRKCGLYYQSLLILERCLGTHYIFLLNNILEFASNIRIHGGKSIEGLCKRALRICSLNTNRDLYNDYTEFLFRTILKLKVSFDIIPGECISCQYISEIAIMEHERIGEISKKIFATYVLVFCFETWLHMLTKSGSCQSLSSLPSEFHTLGHRMVTSTLSQLTLGLSVFHFLKLTIVDASAHVKALFVEALILCGAHEVINSPDVTDCGKRPLHILVKAPVEVVSVLLSYGAHVDAVDRHDKTPIDYCSSDSPILSLLLSSCPFPLSCQAARTIVSEDIPYKSIDLPKHIVKVIELHDHKSIT